MAAHRHVFAFASAPVAPEQFGTQAVRAEEPAGAVPPNGHAVQPEAAAPVLPLLKSTGVP